MYSRVSIEHQLRLLHHFPDPYAGVTSPGGDGSITKQAVNASDSIAVSKSRAPTHK